MGNGSGFQEDIQGKTDIDLQEPDQYRVILHNDHYTTMEFVVEILRTVFHKNLPEATKIMLDVHRKGRGNVGTYTYDIARTRLCGWKNFPGRMNSL